MTRTWKIGQVEWREAKPREVNPGPRDRRLEVVSGLDVGECHFAQVVYCYAGTGYQAGWRATWTGRYPAPIFLHLGCWNTAREAAIALSTKPLFSKWQKRLQKEHAFDMEHIDRDPIEDFYNRYGY